MAHQCALMIGAADESEPPTQFGPMVIFGMAVFRKYAVQFDLAGDFQNEADSRVMRFAEAGPDCSGAIGGSQVNFARKQSQTLRKVDITKLRVSPLQQKLTKKKLHSKLLVKGV